VLKYRFIKDQPKLELAASVVHRITDGEPALGAFSGRVVSLDVGIGPRVREELKFRSGWLSTNAKAVV